jgi:hypothetical protein
MPTTIFKNIRVFDGEKIHQSATVVVKDGKISSVSKSAPSTIEDGATTIDGAGHTLLPGLIEAHMHAHLSPGQGIIRCFTPVEGSRLLGHVEALLIHSTCLDMHNTPDDVIRLKKECAASAQLPDLKSAFYGATIEGGWPKPIVLHLDPSPEVSQQIENALQDRNRY